MKLLIDTEKFHDSEYDTLLSCLKEQETLALIQKHLDINALQDMYITIHYEFCKDIGTSISKKFPRELLKQLLDHIKIEMQRDLNEVLEHIGAKEVE